MDEDQQEGEEGPDEEHAALDHLSIWSDQGLRWRERPFCGMIQTFLVPEDWEKLSQVKPNQWNKLTKGRPFNFQLLLF